MALSAKNLIAVSSSSSKARGIREQLKGRESEELIVAFSAPLGSGIKIVADLLETELRQLKYEVVRIKLSDFIQRVYQKENDSDLLDPTQAHARYQKLQEAGTDLRKRHGGDFLAELAITKIAKIRLEDARAKGIADDDIKSFAPVRRAYVIDQLKHQDEVELLRTVYGNLFYLIGVFASEEHRKANLEDSLPDEHKPLADQIMRKDQKEENEDLGQQLEKTLKLADLFIRNSNNMGDRISNQLKRFLNILHGVNGLTPTQHEYAMYAAYSAGLRSACLSRQVGASITDSEGNILSTGCNDVPKAGGGLYSAESAADNRCYNHDGGKCYNDERKNRMQAKIASIIQQETELSLDAATTLAAKIKKDTGLKDILEYSRSVHAEMDAITTIARKGGITTENGYLYTTTYPCHNCARHIIAAGISKVFYIEPYEKSLAKNLHRDALERDTEIDGSEQKIVEFLHFEGVSPRQYQSFFYPPYDRKDGSGKAVQATPGNGHKIIAELLDDYRDLESRVIAHVADEQHIEDAIFDD